MEFPKSALTGSTLFENPNNLSTDILSIDLSQEGEVINKGVPCQDIASRITRTSPSFTVFP